MDKEALLKAAGTPLPKDSPAQGKPTNGRAAAAAAKSRAQRPRRRSLLLWVTLLAAASALCSRFAAPAWPRAGLTQQLYDRAHAMSPVAAERGAAALATAVEMAGRLRAQVEAAAEPLAARARAAAPAAVRSWEQASAAAALRWALLRARVLDAADAASERWGELVRRAGGGLAARCLARVLVQAARLFQYHPARLSQYCAACGLWW